MQFNLRLTRDHGVGDDFNNFKASLGVGAGPFCINFGDKLYLIGTKHTRDENSDTYRLIEKIITEKQPKAVFIEGVQHSKGANPPLGGWSGEGYFASTVAAKNNIPYYGAEPSDSDINHELRKYSKCDIVGFYFMRSYRYAYVTAKEPKEKFLADFYSIEMPQLGITCRGWEHRDWFARRFDKTFRWGAFLNYGAPSSAVDAPITRKIAARSSLARDKFYLNAIEKHISRGDRIVFPVGMNHTYAMFEVLRAAFGEYTIALS